MQRRGGWFAIIAVGVGIALFITLFSPFASSSPDGLERVAEDHSFLHHAEGPSYRIIPDYTFPGVHNTHLATILSGIVGVLLVAGIGLALGYGLRIMARGRSDDGTEGTQRSEVSPDTGGNP